MITNKMMQFIDILEMFLSVFFLHLMRKKKKCLTLQVKNLKYGLN